LAARTFYETCNQGDEETMSKLKYIAGEGKFWAQHVILGSSPDTAPEANELLHTALKELGVTQTILENKVYQTNLLKIQLPKNYELSQDEINSWVFPLVSEVAWPCNILALGNTAQRAAYQSYEVYKRDSYSFLVSSIEEESKIYEVHHPAHILQNRNKYNEWKESLRPFAESILTLWSKEQSYLHALSESTH
jgi:uracil-DNA glycosylase family 4